MIDNIFMENLAGSHHDDTRCRYHCHDISDRVVVTIGDSWTYGKGLDPWDHRDHYGRLISDRLDHSCLHFGCIGGSNSWSINILAQIIGFLNHSRYQQGTIIVTLTENGRDINEGRSRPFDYSIYRDRPVDLALFHTVLDDVEHEWACRLLQARSLLDPRFSIIIGTNFCWHQKLLLDLDAVPGLVCLPRSWIECLPGDESIPRIRTTNRAWTDTLLDIIDHQDRKVCKDWVLQTESGITQLFASMRSRKKYFPEHDPGHPNAQGHRLWADALLTAI